MKQELRNHAMNPLTRYRFRAQTKPKVGIFNKLLSNERLRDDVPMGSKTRFLR